jgi:hypothetical protein
LALFVHERKVYLPSSPASSGEVGIWLGLHGERWLSNAMSSVESQEGPDLDVVAVLNGSSRGAEDFLLAWQGNSRHAITIAVNDRNLGPLGSWYRNRDLLIKPWVALLHQDDVYLPHHVSTFASAVSAAPDDVLGVFTAMRGIAEDGSPLTAPPMRNRHLDLAPSQITVPEIIRRHPLPTPASALRNPQAWVDGLAWYDSGAPDSEWFALLACRGRFRIMDEVTVGYRQPSASESSTTGWESRAWQWGQSLGRVIQSRDFGEFLARISSDRREATARSVLEAIPARYPGSPLFGYLQFAAAQRMAEAWDYEPGWATDDLLKVLSAAGESAATRSLESIAGPASRQGTASVELSALLGSAPAVGRVDRLGRSLYKRYGHRFPRWARETAFDSYDRLRPRRGAQ